MKTTKSADRNRNRNRKTLLLPIQEKHNFLSNSMPFHCQVARTDPMNRPNKWTKCLCLRARLLGVSWDNCFLLHLLLNLQLSSEQRPSSSLPYTFHRHYLFMLYSMLENLVNKTSWDVKLNLWLPLSKMTQQSYDLKPLPIYLLFP